MSASSMSIGAREYISSLRTKLGADIAYTIPVLEYVYWGVDALRNTGLFKSDQLQISAEESVGQAVDQIFENMRDRIVWVMRTMGYTLNFPPAVAALPTRDFNAWAMKAPNGEPICVLDTHLWGTITGLAMATCECVFLGKDQQGGDRSSALEALFGAMLCFSGQEGPAIDALTAKFRDIGREPMRFFGGMQLCYGMLVFILAHELAHHALCHLGHPVQAHLKGARACTTEAVYLRKHDKEYEADLMGFRVFLADSREVMPGGSRRLFSQGEVSPLLLFRFLNIYEERILGQSAASTATRATHPHPYARLQRLLAEFDRDADQNAKDIYEYVLPMFEAFDNFVATSTRPG